MHVNTCAPAGWWFDPDWIINELGINSTVTSPAHEEVVTLDSQKEYVVRGYAYSSAPLLLAKCLQVKNLRTFACGVSSTTSAPSCQAAICMKTRLALAFIALLQHSWRGSEVE